MLETPRRLKFGLEILILAALSLTGLSQAGLAAPPGCREAINDVSKMIDDKKANYSEDARAEARRHLATARAQVGQPADCRKEVLAARHALLQGKK